MGLTESTGVSVLLDSDFYLCQYQGLWMCVYSIRSFSGCIGKGRLCIWGRKYVLGRQEWDISVGVCVFSFI